MTKLPADHQRFLQRALPVLQADERVLGVAGAGSWITGTMDAYSDLDLVVVVDGPVDRFALVESLGDCLMAFTGEHVGEPRLLICLYDDPLLHVDVKFVTLPDFAHRIEDPVIVWERDGALGKAIRGTEPRPPMPDERWIEDRFWIWVHYAALRLGRGELFEVIDHLAFVRRVVLGPMALAQQGELPRGVRRLEALVPHHLEAFKATVATHDAGSCIRAVRATIALYRQLRGEVPPSRVEERAVAYFEQQAAR